MLLFEVDRTVCLPHVALEYLFLSVIKHRLLDINFIKIPEVAQGQTALF